MNCQNNTKLNLIKEIETINDNCSLIVESSSEQRDIFARRDMSEEGSGSILRKSDHTRHTARVKFTAMLSLFPSTVLLSIFLSIQLGPYKTL